MLQAYKMKILSVVPRELLPEATKISQKVLSLDAWSRSSEKSAQQLKDFLLTKPCTSASTASRDMVETKAIRRAKESVQEVKRADINHDIASRPRAL